MPIFEPNADLVGYVLPVALSDGSIVNGRVTGSWALNATYVVVDTGYGETLRVAAQVRRRKELE